MLKPRHPHLAPFVRLWLTFRYQIFSRRYNQLVLEQIGDTPLLILPQVFNPVLLRTGQFMAEVLSHFPFEAIETVLDLGTGSGVGAIFAAQQGAQVVASDINPEAVRCVQLNALLNQVETQVEVRQGDLFASVAGQQFDLVCFNPPFYRGQPNHLLAQAWRGETVFERFAMQLSYYLKPKGQALLILSTDGAGDELLDLLRTQNFEIDIQAERDYINEIVTAYRVIPRP